MTVLAACATANAGRLLLPSKDVPSEWLTLAEQTEFQDTPRYAETMAYCRRLAAASPWIEIRSIGASPEGRDILVLIVSSDRAFEPDAAHADGKAVVFIQNCIHAGECEGKDASMMLVRDLAVLKTRRELLDHVNLLVMPIFNVDGHERFSRFSRINQNGPEEMGWRVTARNLNLNRDYLKADTVEMRDWLRFWNKWQPDFHFDNHTTDGGDWQYDVTYESDHHATADPGIAQWLQTKLYPAINAGLEADGHVPFAYFDMIDRLDPTKGIRSGALSPRYSTGYVSIRNRASLLVETHMLKDYRTRVIGTYNIMKHTLGLINSDVDDLLARNRAADAAAAKLGDPNNKERQVVLSVKSNGESVPITFHGFASTRRLSEVSGGLWVQYDNTKPIEVPSKWINGTEPDKVVTAPLAYIIPPQWDDVIDVAGLHGLRMQRLHKPATIKVDSYRFEDVTFAKRPFEGRFRVSYTANPVTEERTYPAGSVVVRLDQPGAKVAVHLFEPDAPDSLVSWGFFTPIFEQKEYGESYVLEKLARQMMAADPALEEEFETKVREDHDFAGNARARLQFFYKRSPYWDDHMNRYPIGRIVKPLDLPLEPMP